jgi:glycosyltransferase involved in cell wall biosynthesis
MVSLLPTRILKHARFAMVILWIILIPGASAMLIVLATTKSRLPSRGKFGRRFRRLIQIISTSPQKVLLVCGLEHILQNTVLVHNTAYHTKFPEGLKELFGIPEWITWRFVRWFHKHSGKVLTTTDTMVRDLKAHGFDGEVVPWTRGVDREIFNTSHRHDNINGKYLLCVSRVSKEKNLEEFFKLDYPGYYKVMVGDGPMLETYKKQYPDVMFTGFKTGKDLARYYANAEVFVFPSKWETFGIVMIEAMACGTPVAAFPCDGPLDVIDQAETGFMNDDLKHAVDACLQLSRERVLEGSQRWTWDNAWKIFKENLT